MTLTTEKRVYEFKTYQSHEADWYELKYLQEGGWEFVSVCSKKEEYSASEDSLSHYAGLKKYEKVSWVFLFKREVTE